MIERDGDRLVVTGPMTIESVPDLLPAALHACRDGAVRVDLEQVEAVDSAALAFLLELVRDARERDGSLTLSGIPAALRELADLYSLDALLPTES